MKSSFSTVWAPSGATASAETASTASVVFFMRLLRARPPGGGAPSLVGGQAVERLREARRASVLVRDRRVRDRPGDPDVGVVPGDADLAARVVEVRALV